MEWAGRRAGSDACRSMMRAHPLWTVLLLAALMAGCGPAAPAGSTPPPDGSVTATPELTEVGDGTVLESDWRYSVGEEDGSWCARLDVAEASSSRCGDLLPVDGRAFGELGRGPGEYTEAQVVEGFVSADTVTVWLIGDRGQYRIPAVLMPLDDAGLEDVQAYVGFALADVTLTHLQAVALNGDVLETVELP
jgi:hypothetical protein